MQLSCTYIRESRLRTIITIIAGIFVLQMCESYTARKLQSAGELLKDQKGKEILVRFHVRLLVSI